MAEREIREEARASGIAAALFFGFASRASPLQRSLRNSLFLFSLPALCAQKLWVVRIREEEEEKKASRALKVKEKRCCCLFFFFVLLLLYIYVRRLLLPLDCKNEIGGRGL